MGAAVQSGLATAPVNVVVVEGLIAKPRRRPEGQRKHSGLSGSTH